MRLLSVRQDPMGPYFPADVIDEARKLLFELQRQSILIAAAESCTGGLVCAALTEIPGSSAVVDRGFVTYSNAAKTELLGVKAKLIEGHGAVSAEVAGEMAVGALQHSSAHVAIAVTGIAGPGGGSAEKPVGLVHLAAARRGVAIRRRECRFGDIGRDRVRLAAVREALALAREIVAAPPAR